MKIGEPSGQTIQQAVMGKLSSVDEIIMLIQPGIFNLAVRMLGNRDDAADATQEILLKVITHLSQFQAHAAFATWVFRIAKNHLLTAHTKSKEFPLVSLDTLQQSLDSGITFNAQMAHPFGDSRILSPEEKLEAKQIGLACTQKMLMSLDRHQRLSYILDTVLGLSSEEAAAVLEIASDTHRQRLSRARAKLDAFTGESCGRISEHARCQCDQQIPGVRHRSAAMGEPAKSIIAIHPIKQQELIKNYEALIRLGDASALIKAHPQYQAPEQMRQAIRSVLKVEGFISDGKTLPQ